MLTPKFSASQDASHVIVEVWLTGVCRLDLAEASVEDDTLLLTCEPYFLRLHLTGPCVDSDAADAESLGRSSFDADTGVLTLRVRKAQPGQHFPDLGMLGALLCGPANSSVVRATSAMVEELLAGDEPPSCREDGVVDQLDWFVEPEQPAADVAVGEAVSLDVGTVGVGGGLGFAFRRRDQQSAAMLSDLDYLLPKLTGMTHSERLAAKEALELDQFDPDYYLADLLEPSEHLTNTLAMEELQPSPAMEPEERRTRLMALPRRPQLPLNEWEERVTSLALADLLIAFCMDWRVCEGEQTAESGRSLLTQAASLSCQCPLTAVPQLLRSSCRRLLCHGLWRSWRLWRRVVLDAARLLGSKQLTLDCLLRTVALFSARGDSGGFAAMNHLVMADLCLWLQRCPQARLSSLSDSILAGLAGFTKEDAGLGLAEWELVASMEAAGVS